MHQFCKFSVTGKIDTGNAIKVIADAREYDHESVTDPGTNETSMQYVDKGSFAIISAFFEKNPVTDEEINSTLAGLLNLVKGERNVIS